MTQKIKDIFSQFNNQTILIIGDVMIDSYMWGNVDRISPEAPVPVVSVTKREQRLGGAANVGLNIRALGAKPVMCAVIGNDINGKTFFNLLSKREMSSQGIMISQDRFTTVKTRIISNNQHLLRVDEEITDNLNNSEKDNFIKHIEKLFAENKFDAVIFEDYDKGNITPEIIDFTVSKANTLKIPVLVDPKKNNFFDYKNVTLFKPNFKEICEGTKTDIPKGDFEALHLATDMLINKLKAQHVMVTLSELGVFVTENGSYHRIPAQVRDIADVSGAGDTVISVAACCLAAGLNVKKSAAVANIAGGLVCEKVGVVPVEKDILMNEAELFFEHKQ